MKVDILIDLTKPVESEARNYRIKRTVTHEKFNLKTITNDLALIELSETVQITSWYKLFNTKINIY